MSFTQGLIWVALGLAFMGFLIIGQAQWRQPMQRLNDEVLGILLISAASAVALCQLFVGAIVRLFA